MGRVVLGMGGCVDHEVEWDAALVSALAREHGIGVADLVLDGPVRGERDALVALLVHLRDGAGGERFVEDREQLRALARRFATRVTLGGSSVRAAVALDRLGVDSLLHLVSIDDDVRRLLPPSSTWICSAEADSTDPHVIVQYPAGARVALVDGEVVSPRANRVILVNDPPNAELRLAAGFGEAVAQAPVVVVSGFNTMADVDAVAERTAQVREHLAGRRPDAVVVYEDAGFHHDEQRAAVMTTLRGAVDVWSMNEDEAQWYLGRAVDLADAEQVADAVRELAALVRVPTLVIHTGRWALAYGGRPTAALREAVLGGVVTATARYRHGDDWTTADRDAVVTDLRALPTPLADAVEARLEGAALVEIPPLDVARPATIGLGDTFLGGLVAGLVAGRVAA